MIRENKQRKRSSGMGINAQMRCPCWTLETSTISISSTIPESSSPPTREATDVWAGGGAKSIPLIVAFDPALLPIPSFQPFAPASFMLMRRRAPTEDRIAGLPSACPNTIASRLSGTTWNILVPAIIPISLGVKFVQMLFENRYPVDLRHKIYHLITYNDLNDSGHA